MLAYLMMTVLLFVGMLLIFIILLQRGRGGGLAGALGGMGGQSAFGTKAGDVFTRITVVLAVIWIILCASSIPLLRYLSGGRYQGGSDSPPTLVAPPQQKGDVGKPAEDEEPQPPAGRSDETGAAEKPATKSEAPAKPNLELEPEAKASPPSTDEKSAPEGDEANPSTTGSEKSTDE
jgi:preprotein translocase subunit SecG